MAEPTVVPPEPVRDDAIASASLDDLNRNSPLKPLFFDYDSSEVNAAGQAVLDANAAPLKKYPSWTVTIEGTLRRARHRRVQSGIGRAPGGGGADLSGVGRHSADRLRTVSYGKEFPFDPGHDEAGVGQESARALRRHREVIPGVRS